MHLLDAARNGPVRGCPLGCGFLLFVPPSGAYLSYIDWNTLALLFSLMAVMRGLQKVGFFAYTANFLLKRITSTRTLLLILVFLPFFFSMVITNDVALITFVPFGLIVLKMAGQERLAVPQVVLQTVAANLGSMLTPVGNPQNLYLYNKSGIGFGELCGWMLPYVLASGVCLALIIVFRKPVRISGISLTAPLGEPGRSAMLYGRLCAVPSRNFQADPARYRCGCHCGLLLVKDRDTLFKIDYSLLATFLPFYFCGERRRDHSVSELFNFDLGRPGGAGGRFNQPNYQQCACRLASVRLYHTVAESHRRLQSWGAGDFDCVYGQSHFL